MDRASRTAPFTMFKNLLYSKKSCCCVMILFFPFFPFSPLVLAFPLSVVVLGFHNQSTIFTLLSTYAGNHAAASEFCSFFLGIGAFALRRCLWLFPNHLRSATPSAYWPDSDGLFRPSRGFQGCARMPQPKLHRSQEPQDLCRSGFICFKGTGVMVTYLSPPLVAKCQILYELSASRCFPSSHQGMALQTQIPVAACLPG